MLLVGHDKKMSRQEIIDSHMEFLLPHRGDYWILKEENRNMIRIVFRYYHESFFIHICVRLLMCVISHLISDEIHKKIHLFIFYRS